MTNLSITSVCNRGCKYCFAMETLDELAREELHMSMEVFERALDYVERSGMEEVRLLGGEPTVHPRFCEMVDRVLERGLNLLVFSGGIIPKRVLEHLEQVPEERLTILMNVAVAGEDRQSEVDRQPETLRCLGSRIVLGLNIHSPSVKLDFLLEMIEEYRLQRTIRLGIAHPILGGDNRYLHPRHYPEVGFRVAEFALRCREVGVQIDFDCGWVPCMFPEGALEELEITPHDVGLRCSPILDVLANGEAISCYPLADHHRIPLPNDQDAGWLYQQFVERQQPQRAVMLYEKCASCDFRERGECTGGCLSASLKRVRDHSFTLSVHTAQEPARPVSLVPENNELPILHDIPIHPPQSACCGTASDQDPNQRNCCHE